MNMHIGKQLVALLVAGLVARPLAVQAHANDDPWLAQVVIDRLELRHNGNENRHVLEGQAWVGKDIDRLWLKMDAEHVSGTLEKEEIQLLYSRAITPFWNLQTGGRFDSRHDHANSAVIGLYGLSPYFLDIDAALFIGESGDFSARIAVEHEWNLTQRWVLATSLSTDWNAQNDKMHGVGSGLSTAESAVLVRYEIVREFAPYVGVSHEAMFGNTADWAEANGEDARITTWVTGVHIWF